VTQPGLVPATRYCLPGDLIECEVEGIGILRNPVAEAMASAAELKFLPHLPQSHLGTSTRKAALES
jgi:hypothetical protein